MSAAFKLKLSSSLAFLSLFIASCANADSVLYRPGGDHALGGRSWGYYAVFNGIASTVAIAAFALCTWQIIRGAELSSWVAPMIVTALAVATLVNADDFFELLGDTTVNGCYVSEISIEEKKKEGVIYDETF